jgi:hypothetical protein
MYPWWKRKASSLSPSVPSITTPMSEAARKKIAQLKIQKLSKSLIFVLKGEKNLNLQNLEKLSKQHSTHKMHPENRFKGVRMCLKNSL